MKHFLRKSILFSAILIFFIIIFIFFIGKIYKFYPSGMYYYIDFIEAFGEKDFEVVALGNSKLLASIDKETLEQNLGLKPVILGYSSANISISKLTLESYLNKRSVKPKLVLLEVSWFTFNNKRTHL